MAVFKRIANTENLHQVTTADCSQYVRVSTSVTVATTHNTVQWKIYHSSRILCKQLSNIMSAATKNQITSRWAGMSFKHGKSCDPALKRLGGNSTDEIIILNVNWRCFTSQLGAGGPVGSCNEYVLIVAGCLTFEKSNDPPHSWHTFAFPSLRSNGYE